MRTTPGMTVAPNGSFGYVIRGRGGCTPEVFIDGMKVMQGADEIDNLVRPQEVSGVEVYTGSAGVPPQYAGMAGGDCGVVLVWTKRGPAAKKPQP
jgi:TonB-dependent Receptor Plug Domain